MLEVGLILVRFTGPIPRCQSAVAGSIKVLRSTDKTNTSSSDKLWMSFAPNGQALDLVWLSGAAGRTVGSGRERTTQLVYAAAIKPPCVWEGDCVACRLASVFQPFGSASKVLGRLVLCMQPQTKKVDRCN